MKNEWTSIFAGDVWRVKVLQVELEGRGIATFTPDEYVPSQDPHLSGTPTATSELFVRPADVERAREVIAHHERGA